MEGIDLILFLKSIPLFSNANDIFLKEMLASHNAKIISMSANADLDTRFSHSLGVVLEGVLEIQTTDAEKKLSLRTLRKGQVFGAATIFLRAAPPPSSLFAVKDCKVLFLEHDAVRTLLGKDAAFLDAYLAFLADRVQFLNQKIRCFTAGSVERRLALWLAENAKNGPITASSLTGLAEILNVGRASLYRALEKLENDGLVLRNGRELQIPNADELLKKYHS